MNKSRGPRPEPVTVTQAAEKFLAHQKSLFALATYETRVWTLNKFLRYLSAEGVLFLSQLTTEVVCRYEREKKGLFKALKAGSDSVSPRTLRTDTSNIRTFLHFLFRQGLLLEDLSTKLPTKCAPGGLPVPLSPKVIEKWFALCDLSTHTGVRDRAFFELAYGSGLRGGELFALTLSALDLTQGQLLIDHSKNGESRLVPLTRVSCHYLRSYLETARPWLPRTPQTEECLWLTCVGGQMGKAYMSKRIRTFYRARMLPFVAITLHRLRHSCATHLLQSGASVRQVQQLLGHRDINSTQIYTKVAITDLKAVHRRCHPRSATSQSF
jgi:integrase/recombinase XerD